MRLSIFIALFLLNFSLFAQSPYKYNAAVETPVITVGLGSLVTGFVLERKSKALTMQQISMLDRNTISVFDRSATYNWNTKIAKTSDVLMYASMASPLLFLAGERTRKDFGKIALISAEVFLLNTGLTYLTKTLVKRNRPFTYNSNAPTSKKLKRDASHSFFSGHTSTTSSMLFSLAMMHTHYYPNSKWKPLIWFAAAVLPLAMAVLRVQAGKHFWTDVMVGYGVGAAIGVGVPFLHKIGKK